jgi:Protein of unknown function (DUF3298)
MRQKFITILTVSLILIACNSNSTQISESGQATENDLQLPATFYKKFEGSIGDISIVMDLTKKDSILTGQYYNTEVGVPLTLNGNISSDGNFKLSEMNDKYEETAIFAGSFNNNNLISGTWTNSKTEKTLSFNLSEKKENIVEISFESRYSENCKNAEKHKKQPSADVMHWDTLCTSLDLDLIKVVAPSKEATLKINETIKELVCGISNDDKKYSSIDELMNSVNSVDDDAGYTLSIGCALITNDNDILCVSIGQSGYGFGNAHPFGNGNYYNFDIKTGNQILLDDIMLPNFEKFLNQVAEKKFLETNGSDGWDFEKGKFELNRDFAITPGGLLFSFDQYEIGPYLMGSPEVFIPYKDIDNLLKPNGILQAWRKNRSAANKGFVIAGFPRFADTFMQGGSLVLRM